MGALIACSHHASVREEMTWKCEQGRTAQSPHAQAVMFLFVKNSAIGAMHAGPWLCDQLKAAGKPVVTVEYDVWGNSVDGVHGFRPVKIDGKPFKDLLPPFEGVDSIGPNPLAAPFELPRK